MEEKQAWRMIRERVMLMNRKQGSPVMRLKGSGMAVGALKLNEPFHSQSPGVRLIVAFNLLLTALKDSRRKLPYPTFLHCLQVANWLHIMGFSVTAQCIGFHHDSLEDGLLDREMLSEWLGDEVLNGVQALTRPLSSSVSEPVRVYWQEMNAYSRGHPEIAVVKLLDQLDNLHSGFFLVHSPERMREKLVEIQSHLVPLVKTLQITHPLVAAYAQVLECWCEALISDN